MSLSPDRYWWLIPVSLACAILWQSWPFEQGFRLIAPDAIVTVMLFWTLRKPQAISSGLAFAIGLMRDTTEGAPLGTHALAMIIICFIARLLYNPMRLFPLWKQVPIITALSFLYLFIGNWVELLNPDNKAPLFLWVPAFATGFCWPVCFLVLKQLEHGFLRAPVRS